ncbi:alpha/beta hydrolase family protein [Estrella lausannensis]|uniref:Conserved putative secreted protein n=1 Tax=Estrella lausannensis TaxID=483423 RepID=A0A0H5E6F5_9BACT|nr:prolyl oligopeptidase family serine peptidase [Estrella lausannensis]CRX38860.1 Conserved putative secreted protein [Estrella lausannensis]
MVWLAVFLCIPLFAFGATQDAITLDIGVKTIAFHDDLREKLLLTEIYYPAENGTKSERTTTDIFDRFKEARDSPILRSNKKYPLIVVSHGQKGDRFNLSWLLDILAGYGYIIASVDHFGATWSNYDPEESIKRWNRTFDVSHVIDAIIKDPVFGPHIDKDKIGMIGYSLGSLTGLWLAGGIATNYRKPDVQNSLDIEMEEGLNEQAIENLDISEAKENLKDERIKAFLLLAPVYGFAFSKEGLSSIRVPLLIIAASEDDRAPIKENALFFKQTIPSAGMITLSGKADHTIYLNPPSQDRFSKERREAHRIIARETLKFFHRTLKEQ